MNKFLFPLKKWFLLSLLLLVFSTFFFFHLYEYLTFQTLKNYQAYAQQWTLLHYPLAVCLYMLTYILMIACGIPGATVFSLLGGFLFGTIGTLYAIFSTTTGGTLLYFAIRTSIGERIAAKSSRWIKKMEAGFQENAFNYLLALRLMPIFPCWISNIAAGALNVPLKTFLIATVLGITPATFIYVMMGRGLDTLFSAQQMPDLTIMLTPSLLFPLLGLAILSLFPVFYKNVKKTKLK